MIIEGHYQAQGQRIAIVVSRFNDFITAKLLAGAKDCYKRHGGLEKDMDIVYVPGAWELPIALLKLAKSGKYDGLLALGCVIRGSTAHFDYVAGEACKGVLAVSTKIEMPIGFGILTTDTIEQAIERAGSKQGNKGWDGCLSLIETINVLKQC